MDEFDPSQLLGFVKHEDRTPEEWRAHEDALAQCVQFAYAPKQMEKGQKIALYEFWKHPDVVADVGFAIERIHQITGSCVWAGGTNALMTTIAAQRVADDNPTQAFLPFTLHDYTMSRHMIAEMSGKRSWDQAGEGSMGSTFGKALTLYGTCAWKPGELGMPAYTRTDGISVTKADELLYSSYLKAPIKPIIEASKEHLLGAAGECKSVENILSMVQNGNGVSFACDRFIGHAKLQGSGSDACVMGYWDTDGGHQQSILGVWNHTNFGMLYWAQNNWPRQVYPIDPAGGPICGCWVTEKNVIAALRYHAEVFGLSHVNWFPARPRLLRWGNYV